MRARTHRPADDAFTDTTWLRVALLKRALSSTYVCSSWLFPSCRASSLLLVCRCAGKWYAIICSEEGRVGEFRRSGASTCRRPPRGRCVCVREMLANKDYCENHTRPLLKRNSLACKELEQVEQSHGLMSDHSRLALALGAV